MKKRTKISFAIISTLCVCMLSPFRLSSATSKKIGLNKNQVSLNKNQSYVLKLKGVTNKKIKWSSSNKKVATVKNGIISAQKTGSCIITAKYAKKKYKCSVNVKQNVANVMNENNTTTPSPSNAPTTEPTTEPTAEPTVVPAKDDGKILDYSFSTIDNSSNILMDVQLNLSNKNILSLKISNKSSSNVTMDNYFELEYLDNGEWSHVNFKENSSFEEILLVVKNNSDYVQNIDLERYFTELSKGKYRISKHIAAANQVVISAEFTID